ncbi:MAG TPA: hypothetical protein VLI92_04270 [Candidatus Saccharimonadales bacterium]|nr:hypothetical protein [Candidatus Saccharimonadales bacterium]
MPKVLKATFQEKCIRCELCIMEAQRQLDKIGLEGSLIRVFRDTAAETKNSNQKISFAIYLDPQVNKLDIEKIKASCPTAVFTIEEEENHGLLS